MRLNILNNRDDIIKHTTNKLIDKINQHDKSTPFVLGLSTGATVFSICEALTTAVQEKKVSLKNVVIFYAGEYVGFSKISRGYYFEKLHQDFFSKVDILSDNIHIFDGNVEDLEKECHRYEQEIQELGGMDLFLGALGSGGELAFNDPGSALHSRTRVKTLTSELLKSDARFFNNEISKVPKTALTMGIGTIFDAKEIIIVVYGIQKAFAVKSCLEGPISTMSPASILQMHPTTYFYVDKVAGRLLTKFALHEL